MLKIRIEGTANSGKSTIAILIKEALDKAGIESKILDEEMFIDFYEQGAQSKRIEAIKKRGLQVEIEVNQLNRVGLEKK